MASDQPRSRTAALGEVGDPDRESLSHRLARYRRDGTLDIVGGSLVAGLAALAYEVIGGRTLGVDGFAPVTALLTLHFLVFLIVLIPLEQVTIRRLTVDPSRPGIPVGAVGLIGGAAALASGLSWLWRGRLFGGDGAYAVLVAATIVTHGGFALARGYLAGRRRYRSYGLTSGAAALLRLALGGVVLALAVDGRLFGLALAAGPIVAVAWRPFSPSVDAPSSESSRVVDLGATEGRMVFGLVLASAAAQAMLLAGPVVAALLGAGPAAVSIVFVTFSLLRAPLSLGYNLLARLLPPLTTLAQQGAHGRLTRLTRIGGAVTLVAALIGGVAGYWTAPGVVAMVFGAEFRPEAWFSALVAGGVVVAAGSLAIGQVFVARGDTGRLADAWLVGSVTAAVFIAVPVGEPALRVAAAFLAGELAAMTLLVAQAHVLPPAGTLRRLGRRRFYSAGKRGFDLLIGISALLFFLPVMAVIAAAIVSRTGRPALISQTRIGRRGVPFGMWKFRTMDVDADPRIFWAHIKELADAAGPGSRGQPDLRIHDDPRLTAVGRTLRRWSLDELPNLWNVVRGEMSLVGPRPLLEPEADLIRARFGSDAAVRRQAVLPGITGLAQVEGRDEITVDERARLDERYLVDRSLSLDLWLVLRTITGVFRHRGV